MIWKSDDLKDETNPLSHCLSPASGCQPLPGVWFDAVGVPGQHDFGNLGDEDELDLILSIYGEEAGNDEDVKKSYTVSHFVR